VTKLTGVLTSHDSVRIQLRSVSTKLEREARRLIGAPTNPVDASMRYVRARKSFVVMPTSFVITLTGSVFTLPGFVFKRTIFVSAPTSLADGLKGHVDVPMSFVDESSCFVIAPTSHVDARSSLVCATHGSVSDPFIRGAHLFDAGEFFEAHEVWEERWRVATDKVEREFLQGLIQIAAAFHKLLVMKSAAAASRLLARGLAKLDACPPEVDGMDLAALRARLRTCATELAAGRFTRAAIPKLGSCHAQRDR
jgi:hypothetical protein